MEREWNDSQPIYRQLRDRVVAMILDGVLKEGDPLPSVRIVAAEFRVNPLTVLKGYQQLVDEELVESRRGRGMFVNAGARDLLLEGERQRFLEEEWPACPRDDPAARTSARRNCSSRERSRRADHDQSSKRAACARAYGATVAARRRRPARRRGPHPRAHRPERRGQDHRAQRDPRPHALPGELQVLGRDPWTERDPLMREVCFIADVAVLPRWMRVSQALDYVEGVHPRFDRAKAEGFLAKTNIRRTSKVRELSKGMVTQLHLALVMAIDAKLLVLDEPTLGLDILYRKQFYDSLLNDYFDRSARSW